MGLPVSITIDRAQHAALISRLEMLTEAVNHNAIVSDLLRFTILDINEDIKKAVRGELIAVDDLHYFRELIQRLYFQNFCRPDVTVGQPEAVGDDTPNGIEIQQ